MFNPLNRVFPCRAAYFATKADLKARKWMQSFRRYYKANLQLNFTVIFRVPYLGKPVFIYDI